MPDTDIPAVRAGPRAKSFLERNFEHRSGRIIALCRMVLAAVFWLALLIDPDQPVRSSAAGYVLLSAYLVLAAVLMAVAWRSWWWDRWLAGPVHLADIFVFLAAVYFTESTSDDFTSPFLAFFAFLMLSATIRWDWRVTGLTGLAVTALYLLVGLAMGWSGIDLDFLRFGRRVVYMAVLALVLIWFGLQRREQHVERFVEPPGGADDGLPPLNEALRYAMTQSGAQVGAIAWTDEEEPHVEVRAIGLGCATGRLPPAVLPPDAPFAKSARLFDSRRNRSLRIRRQYQCVPVIGPIEDPFAAYCGLAEGLSLPFKAVTGRGEILLGEIDGACADHVEIGALIAREVGAGFDRQATLTLVREGALTRMRDALARDLHDTIAQSLAGVSLRIEGLRTWISAGGDPEAEIQSIKAALRAEQGQVRGMIDRLRLGDNVMPDSSVAGSIAPLLSDLAGYWGISANLDTGSAEINIPGWLRHELRQLLREAVANAVRHGAASQISIAITEEAGMLELTIADNGTGFPEAGPGPRPRSISERIAGLRGALDIQSSAEGARLRFSLPLERE